MRERGNWLSRLANPNALWSAIDAAAAPVGAIALTAALLRALGAELFGIIVVVQAFSAISLSITPAVAATTLRFIAAARGEGDDVARKVQTTLSAAVVGVLSLGVLLVVVVWLGRSGVASLLLGAEQAKARPEAAAALVLALAAVAIQQVDTVVAASLKGLECFRQQALYEAASKCVVTVCVICAAFLTRNLTAVLWVQLLGFVCSIVGRALLLRRLVPGRRMFRRFTLVEALPIVGFGGWMWLSSAATAAFGTVDRVVIGRSLGSAAAGEYHVYSQILQFAHYVPASVLAFTFPAFSRLLSERGSEARAQARRLYLRTHAMASAFGLLCIGILLMGGTLVLSHLTGVTVEKLPAAYVVLAVAFGLLTFNIAPYYLVLASGQSRTASLITSSSVIASVACLTALIAWRGIEGAALARCIYAVGTISLLFVARRTLRGGTCA